MWILPKQLITSASALATKESEADSQEFSQLCATSLTWRGKDSQPQTWLRRWKREPWLQHLSIRTLRPSHSQSFVDAWTSSLVDSRANPSVLLENVRALKILDTSSHTSPKESDSANHQLSFSKMSKEFLAAEQEMVNPFSNMSCEHWKEWVTEQRREYSVRLKLARHIRESGSTSLAWPTASVAGCVEGGVVSNVEMTSTGFKATRKSGTSYGAKLRDAVETYEKKNWATPQTFDSNNIVRTPEKLAQTRAEKNAGCMNLREQVHYPRMDHSRKAAKNWPTVTVGEEKYRIKGNSQASKCLSAMAARGELGHPDQAKSSTTGKSRELQWPTPRANKVQPKITEENRSQLATRKKANLEEEIAGHCGKAVGQLNPDWVESLMGLPTGWTDFAFSEME